MTGCLRSENVLAISQQKKHMALLKSFLLKLETKLCESLLLRKGEL
jgi:hypothetical protein